MQFRTGSHKVIPKFKF